MMKKQILKYNSIINGLKVIVLAIFPFITLPYVTRVLGVDNIGLVQFSSVLVSSFVLMANLGINSYAIRKASSFRKNRNKISMFASEIFSINLFTTIIAFICLFLITVLFQKIYSYHIIIWILSIQLFLNLIGFEWLFTIYEKFFYMTIRSIIFQLISCIGIFAFVHTKEDVLLYVIFTLISNSFIYLVNFFQLKKYIDLKIIINNNYKKHIRPMLMLFVSELSTQIFLYADIFMLGIMTNNYYVGYYAIPVKVYSFVKRIINQMIIVFLPRLAYYNSRKSNEFIKLLSQIINISIFIVLPVMTLLFLLSNNIIYILSGKGFESSFLTLKILSLSLLFAILANIFCNGVLIIKEEEKYVLKANAIVAILNIILNMLMINRWQHNGAAFTTLISEMLIMIFLYMKAKKYIQNLYFIKSFIYEIIGCVGIVLLYLIISKLILNNFLEIIIVSIFGLLIYLGIQLLLRNENIKSIKELK